MRSATSQSFLDQNIVLENDVALLRPLQSADFDLLLPFSIQEPELWNYSLVPGNGRANLKKYIDTAIEGRELGHSYPFIVFDKRTQEVAGSTRFYDLQWIHSCVQLGYTWYGSRFHGTGLNKNCKLLMLDFAFDQLAMERVEFRADLKNEVSIAAMKSIGCIEEGVLRSNCQGPESRRDSIVLSILRSEWLNGVRERLMLRCASYGED